VHVHSNLLGWAALGLAGLLYTLRPSLQHNRLAHAHYWLHTVGLMLLMGGFAWRSVVDRTTIVPIALGASMLALGLLLFAVNLFNRRRPRAASAALQ
jgi:hypothetical protein